MTMGDGLLLCLLEAAWKSPFIPAVVNSRSVGEILTKIKDPSVVEPTRGGMFSVRGTGLRAVLSIYLHSFGHAGWELDTGDTFLSLPGGFRVARKGWVSSLFRLLLLPFPPSFDYNFHFLPLSSLTPASSFCWTRLLL